MVGHAPRPPWQRASHAIVYIATLFFPEARFSQSDSSKSASLVYYAATLEVCLTFLAVKKFCYKNLHFVLLSFILSAITL